MVRIIDFKERISADGISFMALILQGGVEVVESQTGKLYATAKKASIVSSFKEEECKHLLGTEIPGEIVRVDCDPYEYTHPATGEVLWLEHRYEYVPEMPKGAVEVPGAIMDTIHVEI